MMKRTFVAISILLLMVLGIAPVSAVSNLTVGNKEFSSVGENATIDFYLDAVPDGLVGGKYLVHITDERVASITGVKFPPWALLKASSTNLRNDVWLKILAQPAISKGTSEVYLGSVVVTAKKTGSTPVTVQLSDPTDIPKLHYRFEDIGGKIISINVIPGVITVPATKSPSVPALFSFPPLNNLENWNFWSFSLSARESDHVF